LDRNYTKQFSSKEVNFQLIFRYFKILDKGTLQLRLNLQQFTRACHDTEIRLCAKQQQWQKTVRCKGKYMQM